MIKKKILLVDYNYKDGGPKTVNKNIIQSYLANKYDFRVINSDNAVFHYNPLKALRFIRYYIKAINKEHGDIAYIRGLEYVGLLMTLACRLSNVKESILVVHGSVWDDPDDHSLRHWLLKYIIEPLEILLADKVITVCKSEQKTCKSLRFARKEANEGCIYNTFPNIDYDVVSSNTLRHEFDIQQDKIVVISVGRVVERKGHQYLIDAIKKNKDPNFVFVIVGDGIYVNEYRKRCQQEIADHQLLLLGSRSDVYALLKDSDIFVFPTLNENHSMALLEAINMHCAVVATNVGGNPETIEDGKTGLLIEPKSSEQIIEALLKLKDVNLRKKYSDAAFEYASSHFSMNNTLGKLDELFEK